MVLLCIKRPSIQRPIYSKTTWLCPSSLWLWRPPLFKDQLSWFYCAWLCPNSLWFYCAFRDHPLFKDQLSWFYCALRDHLFKDHLVVSQFIVVTVHLVKRPLGCVTVIVVYCALRDHLYSKTTFFGACRFHCTCTLLHIMYGLLNG